MTPAAWWCVAGLTALVLVAEPGDSPVFAREGQVSLSAPSSIPGAASAPLDVVIRSQHRRLTFAQDIERIAVGDSDILTAELITSREVLVLGRETGRTTLIVWFGDGSFREHVFSVKRDLSVLERALRLVDPSIQVDSAPDRDALVLTGTVPDQLASQTAEAIARNYLDAGKGRAAVAQPLIAAPSISSAPAPDAGTAPAPAAGAQGTPGAGLPAGASGAQGGQVSTMLLGAAPPSGTIINLLQLEHLPPSLEQRVLDAIQPVGGGQVTARVLRSSASDTLVLEGRVANQVALGRVLTVAALLFAGQTITGSDIRVLADESGALVEQSQGMQTQQGGGGGGGGGGASSSMFGGAKGARLTNEVRTNFGRAKTVEVADGRILSFIEVTDLPQVRVDIRLEEINRSKLRAWDPNAVLALSSFRQPSLNPAQSAGAVQGDQAARVGSSGAAIQNVLSFLNGGLLNQLQYAGSHMAIDAAVAFLEREGIARSLSSPSLTVLSGESAHVQVGGEVPVPVAFSPAFGTAGTPGAATPGVFSSVDFVPFGVQLQIRPLVGDDNTITLDVQPLVVTPDTVLTNSIRQSTGASVPTTAFQTRALRTSARVQDGQALIIGGLLSNNTSSNTASTPGLRGVPLLGRMFESFNRNDQTTELVIIVNPVVLRAPVPDAALWAFPGRDELMRSLLAGLDRPRP